MMPKELKKEELRELIKKARDLLEFQQVMADEPVVLILGHEPVLDLGITLGIQVALEEFTQKERPDMFRCSICGGTQTNALGQCLTCIESGNHHSKSNVHTPDEVRKIYNLPEEENDKLWLKKYDRENDEVPSGTYKENPDGTWSEAEPLDYVGHLDFEVWNYDKYYAWEAYDGSITIGEGVARTKLGCWWQMFQFRHFWKEAGPHD
jgi:hypothetical protein